MNCPIYDVGVGAGVLSCSGIAEILGKDISRGRAVSCHSRDRGLTRGWHTDSYSLWIYHFISTQHHSQCTTTVPFLVLCGCTMSV